MIVGERLERGADDLEVAEQVEARQVQETREQLAARQIPSGAEEDDDVRSRRVHDERKSERTCMYPAPSLSGRCPEYL